MIAQLVAISLLIYSAIMIFVMKKIRTEQKLLILKTIVLYSFFSIMITEFSIFGLLLIPFVVSLLRDEENLLKILIVVINIMPSLIYLLEIFTYSVIIPGVVIAGIDALILFALKKHYERLKNFRCFIVMAVFLFPLLLKPSSTIIFAELIILIVGIINVLKRIKEIREKS